MREDPYDRLESAAEAVMARAELASNRILYERGNRLGLLWVHAVVGTLAGGQQLIYGSASQVEQITGPSARLALGPLAFLGGLVLALGLSRRPRRSIPLEGVGLALLASWDLAMTAGLAYARWHQHDFHLLGFHTPMPPGYVPAYPVAVYGGMFALLVIHLATLRHLRRLPKEAHRGEH